MLAKLKPLFVLAALCAVVLFHGCQKEAEVEEPIDPKVEKFTLPEGFVIEHIYSPSDEERGSWVSMTFDDRGRMIASDQFGGLYRLTIPEIGNDSIPLVIDSLHFPLEGEALTDTSKRKVGMGFAQGLLWAHNSLYVMVNHRGDEILRKGSGLYRLQDTNNDDEFDKITQLLKMEGEGEHGPHSVVLGPDGESIYIVAGNHTDIPEMDSYRLPANWQEDNLLQQIKDPQGHATDRTAPGGWIAITDSVGSTWELFAAGFRNTFDIAFNPEGELFAYDSDMEWDFGMSWYRPTRILHVTSGSEFGWRTGNGKWAPYYPDNLPAMINIGQGSPTNLIYGTKSLFPDKYRNSLFAFDWSFGIVYAVSLEEDGATYTANAEEFIAGSPLPLTDGEIGPDGALYFLTGGRELESDLYRVYYKDYQEIAHDAETDSDGVNAYQRVRRKIEEYHTKSDPKAIDFIWPYLRNKDRHIRYAARIALENQALDGWKDRAFQERSVQATIQSMIAMARVGEDADLQSSILRKLMTIDLPAQTEENQLGVLRAAELTLSRLGMPEEPVAERLISYFEQLYPAETNTLNRELSKVLVHLNDDEAISKTLDLLAVAEDDSTYQETVTKSSDLILRNPQYGLDIANLLTKTPPAQQIYFATVLSKAKEGWTDQTRERYFKWFYDAFGYKGGNSYIGFVNRARTLALEHVPDSEFDHYNKLSGDSLVNQAGTALFTSEEGPKGPGRPWKMDEALEIVEADSGKRDFEQGLMLFSAIRCKSCHSMQGEGGAIGPDLTQLGSRFTAKDMLEAIIEPNNVISDQYASTVFSFKDGSSMLAKLIDEDEDVYIVSQNPYAPHILKEIPKKDVSSFKLAEISVMPPGTINVLNEDELKDLIAYLMAGGDEGSEVYDK
ncbi:c-type cytochrome [Albibacterium profundi]|uniref:Heme-binding protein n=1 Tax=Albibacterium profundi TaxID=3134906 RepID=A0ABV5CG04_9SPHI